MECCKLTLARFPGLIFNTRKSPLDYVRTVILEPTKLILVGTRITYKANGDAGACCYYLVCINVFLLTSAFFPLLNGGLFSCYRLRGTQEARLNTTAQGCALTEVQGMFFGGSNSHVTTGRYSAHVDPSRPMQTHAHVSKLSDGSCDT